MSDWWDDVAAELQARSEHAPDPWADFVEGATRITLNGQAKTSIPGDAFNAALMKVWLGDKPVQADLRKAMLGG